MKLARITLPAAGNLGADLWHEHQLLKQTILNHWGGYTSFHADGAWLPPGADRPQAERVVVYEVAMALGDAPKLRAVAARFARICDQQCVMIVTPNGDVDFVKPELTATADPA